MTANRTEERIGFLDGMRVIACFMVIMVHSCEFFITLDPFMGTGLWSDGWWVSLIDSAFRCSVPLFVMISAYLLMPVKVSIGQFYKRRLVRVAVPFMVWSVLYATLPYLWGAMSGQEVFSSLCRLLYNFNDASGHLWFVYMLIGVYLVMPVISPWLERADRKAEQIFLLLWFVSTCFPYLRAWLGEVYGECSWNEFHLFWYFSGFIGYVVLAHYLRCHLRWTVKKQLLVGILLYVAGYAFTAAFWYCRLPMAVEFQDLELGWGFCCPNVAMTGVGAFLVIRSLFSCKGLMKRIVTEVSKLSYGIYLMHIFVLNAMYQLLQGLFSTPVTIVLVAALTFLVCCLLAKLFSCLPGGRFIVG